MVCPNCGQSNDNSSKFCLHCGTALGAQPVQRQYDGEKTRMINNEDSPSYQENDFFDKTVNINGNNGFRNYEPQQSPPINNSASYSQNNAYSSDSYGQNNYHQNTNSSYYGFGVQSQDNRSYFDGNSLQLIGWSILCSFISVITLGFGIPWAICLNIRWETRHTVINGKRLYFNGTAPQLFGKLILWNLIIIAIGVASALLFVLMMKSYSTARYAPLVFAVDGVISLFLFPAYIIYIKKWIAKHTVFAD